MFIALVVDSGSVGNTEGRGHLWYQKLSSAGRSFRIPLREIFKIRSLIFPHWIAQRLNCILDFREPVTGREIKPIRSHQWSIGFQKHFSGLGNTKQSDCCKDVWNCIIVGLNNLYISTKTHIVPSEQIFVTASKGFCTHWTTILTAVLFTALWTWLGLFSPTSQLMWTNSWMKVLSECCFHTYLISHLYFSLTVVEHQLRGIDKVWLSYQSFSIAKDVKEKLSNPARLHRNTYALQKNCNDLANFLSSKLVKRQVLNCRKLRLFSANFLRNTLSLFLSMIFLVAEAAAVSNHHNNGLAKCCWGL